VSLCVLRVQVWGSLVSSLVSALLGLGGVAYLCWLLAEGPASKLLCDSDAFRLSGPQETRCRQNLTILNVSHSLWSRSLVVSNGLWWSLLVSVGLCWSDGLWWSLMVSDGLWSRSQVSDGL